MLKLSSSSLKNHLRFFVQSCRFLFLSHAVYSVHIYSTYVQDTRKTKIKIEFYFIWYFQCIIHTPYIFMDKCYVQRDSYCCISINVSFFVLPNSHTHFALFFYYTITLNWITWNFSHHIIEHIWSVVSSTSNRISYPNNILWHKSNTFMRGMARWHKALYAKKKEYFCSTSAIINSIQVKNNIIQSNQSMPTIRWENCYMRSWWWWWW